MLPRAKKSFGQNFLIDKRIVAKIIEAAEITPGERVLEIGPGTGILTEALVAAGARVTAVEADRDFISALREKFGDRIELVAGDILRYRVSEIPRPGIGTENGGYKLVANIPYNITSQILERFLTVEPRPTRMVLMVQREVADRITALPPPLIPPRAGGKQVSMSLLSVVCQLYADVKKITNVPRGAFRPAPKVDSAIIVLVPLLSKEGLGVVTDPESVIRLAKAGFASRRKQLHRNLAAAGFGTSDQIKRHLAALGLPPTARAENLTVHNWIELTHLL